MARKVMLTAAGALLLPLVSAVPAAADDGVILNAEAKRPVEGSYIVTLKDTSTLRAEGVQREARRLTRKYAGDVGFVYTRAVSGFQALLSEDKAKRLAANPAVKSVEQDVAITVSDTQPNPPSWGLDRLDQKNLPLSGSYTYPSTASNVTAYIVDTGILTSHADLGGRATSGRDFIDNDADANDCNGHGTHVAGTVGGNAHGVAKGVKLVGVRVLDCKGSGTTAGVIAGVDWVTANAVKPAVANMSLGGGASAALDDAVERAVAAGITFAVAAGNENTNACTKSPARAPNALTVGATTSGDARASFSNYGTCLDVFAPGQDITSAWIGGDTATKKISGTSMASPHVAGAAALVLAANPGHTPAQVASALTGAAATGLVTSPGSGSPNRLLFTTEGTSPPPPGPCDAVTSTNAVAVKSWQTASSPLTVSGCTGNASATTKVTVDVTHPRTGALGIDLVAPDGTVYSLKAFKLFDATANLKATYTVNASTETKNGTWNLRVSDWWFGTQGTLNSWTLAP
ncbi:S8 family peptidase [Thermomonospora umbrina]|uniref:Subtilisin family serine protease n=1 Tax=Thermomonospora umbrina TaxID=111806 RepID=A0A3D9SNU4_9ACTN|nr:S8 family peptidase [Thermomonospora umbrina]REE95633.1 subtilisin family serine protease [Thermomonospora umbrina]